MFSPQRKNNYVNIFSFKKTIFWDFLYFWNLVSILVFNTVIDTQYWLTHKNYPLMKGKLTRWKKHLFFSKHLLSTTLFVLLMYTYLNIQNFTLKYLDDKLTKRVSMIKNLSKLTKKYIFFPFKCIFYYLTIVHIIVKYIWSRECAH